jgi:hypothetical protein
VHVGEVLEEARQRCVVLQVGWQVAYDGYGGFGVIKVRAAGQSPTRFSRRRSRWNRCEAAEAAEGGMSAEAKDDGPLCRIKRLNDSL